FGAVIWDRERQLDGPYLRRSSAPTDVSAWEPEERSRLFNLSELHTLQLPDGALLLAGWAFHARFDVVEPVRADRWSAARQVLTQRTTASGSDDGRCSGNRFTKAVFEQGPDGTLYTVWGWGGGGGIEPRPSGCEDVRHYPQDSHQVFFAYSE